VARRTLEGYERALEVPRGAGHGARRGAGRKRLAVVTPWTTAESGAYGRRLVEALAEHADVDVIAAGNGDGHSPGGAEPRVTVRDASEFDWLRELRDYDATLQVLGGSPSHVHVLEAILEVPGVVLANDVGLLGLYMELHRHSHLYDPYWLEDKLVEMYGDRMPPGALRLIPQDDPLVKRPVNMTPEIQSRARRILVHSRYQAEILRLESPANAAPVEVIPRAIPTPPAHDEANGHLPGDPVVVVPDAAGVGAPLLEGFARLAVDRPGARLIVLGELPDEVLEPFRQLAARLGIAGSVELRGRVPEAEYWSVLGSADVAIRLPPATEAGEASDAVCDCIAARVPAVVRSGGWEAELPEPVVLTVPVECTAGDVARRVGEVLGSPELAERARAAQESYAAENSFARVTERFLELLAL
jgi:hypothetical protein